MNQEPTPTRLQVVKMRGTPIKQCGRYMLTEFKGGRFALIPLTLIRIRKHKNEKMRDYITVEANYAEKIGLVAPEPKGSEADNA